MTSQRTFPRRSFLHRCTSLAACGVAGGAGAMGLLLGRRACSLKDLTIDDFQEHFRSQFLIESDQGDRVAAELSEVLPSRFAPGPVGRRRPFSVLFRLPGSTRLPQGVYAVRHSRLGTHRYLLVPVDGLSKNNDMEAVFG